MKLFGININNLIRAGSRLKKEDVIFWGIAGLAALLLAFLFAGGFIFYKTLANGKPPPALNREPVVFSVAQIDEIIAKLNERKIEFDEILSSFSKQK